MQERSLCLTALELIIKSDISEDGLTHDLWAFQKKHCVGLALCGLCESRWCITLPHLKQNEGSAMTMSSSRYDSKRTRNHFRPSAASRWPFGVSLAEFPGECGGQSCVCLEGASKGNMSHDHLPCEPNEAPFAPSNLPLTSAAFGCKRPCKLHKSGPHVSVRAIVFRHKDENPQIKHILLLK